MANKEIRQMMKDEKVPMWQVAYCFRGGVHENTMRRFLRLELGLDEKGEVLAAIKQAKKEFHKGG